MSKRAITVFLGLPRPGEPLEGHRQHPVAIHLTDVTRKDQIRGLVTEQRPHFPHPAIVLVFMVNKTHQERAEGVRRLLGCRAACLSAVPQYARGCGVRGRVQEGVKLGGRQIQASALGVVQLDGIVHMCPRSKEKGRLKQITHYGCNFGSCNLLVGTLRKIGLIHIKEQTATWLPAHVF
jgi:hypothetical protein